MKRKLGVLACALVLTGWLASVASACHAEIRATMDCNGVVHFTATAADGQGSGQGGRDPRENGDVRVYAGDQQIGSGSFNRGNGYSFDGDWSAPAGVDHLTLWTKASGRWGDDESDDGPRSITVDRPSSAQCGPPPCPQGTHRSGSQCVADVVTCPSGSTLQNGQCVQQAVSGGATPTASSGPAATSSAPATTSSPAATSSGSDGGSAAPSGSTSTSGVTITIVLPPAATAAPAAAAAPTTAAAPPSTTAAPQSGVLGASKTVVKHAKPKATTKAKAKTVTRVKGATRTVKPAKVLAVRGSRCVR